MAVSLYQSAIPGFIAMLGNMKAWLDKAAAHGDETALLDARLAPDMHPLPNQIQIATDGAKGVAARLTGGEAPAMPDTEATFAELKDRCDRTIAYLQSIDPAAFDAGANREIVLTFPNGGGLKCDGATFVSGFAVPNFMFHATATYAILRSQGVPLGKADFLMHMAPHMFAPG
ncbi:DUF1993 family protein [Novosphingobium aquiterrae]|uniref:DUF1993 family protein n=1 Tax=Novosphingobium aquiterrae TaxID=624388 RepID=A0ABV6PK78_9SPHN